jgi:predicted Zn-dependent protease
MIGQQQALELLTGIVRQGGDAEVEAVLTGLDRHLTRFADNQIHQNMSTADLALILRVAVGRRVGVVMTNRLDPAHVQGALQRARELARLQPENPHFVGFAAPQPVPPQPAAHASTVEATPQDRATLVQSLAGMLRSEGMSGCGRVSTTVHERAVLNSRGLSAYAQMGEADMVAVVSSPEGGTGYACRISPALAALGVEDLAREVITTTHMAEDPQEVPAGAYDVVLAPYAAGTLVEYLSYAGLGGLSYLEGRSFMSERLGQRITGERIHIRDDARDPALPGQPFDWEGVPTRRLDLIRDGVAVAVAHDTTTGARAGTGSTGHAQPATSAEGGAPTHLVMAGGDQTLDQLVRQVRRGLLVTRFHYTNIVDPKATLATGLTRDGLLRIEDGEIVGAAHNLRFTESILDAFGRCEGLTGETRVAGEFDVRVKSPGMLIRGFHFTGQAGS